MAGVDLKYDEELSKHIELVFTKKIVPENFLLAVHKYNAKVLTKADIQRLRKSCDSKSSLEVNYDLLLTMEKYQGWFDVILKVCDDSEVKQGYLVTEFKRIKSELDKTWSSPPAQIKEIDSKLGDVSLASNKKPMETDEAQEKNWQQQKPADKPKPQPQGPSQSQPQGPRPSQPQGSSQSQPQGPRPSQPQGPSQSQPQGPRPSQGPHTETGGAVHVRTTCDGCGKCPVIGIRFKCCTCPNFDLCQNCEGKGLHTEHIMYRITQPLARLLVIKELDSKLGDLPLASNKKRKETGEVQEKNRQQQKPAGKPQGPSQSQPQGPIPSQPQGPSQSQPQGPRPSQGPHTETGGVVHVDIICNGCMGPVIGIRFKCCTCPDFDLCQNCEGKGLHIEHNMYRITQPRVRSLIEALDSKLGDLSLALIKKTGEAQEKNRQQQKPANKPKPQPQGPRPSQPQGPRPSQGPRTEAGVVHVDIICNGCMGPVIGIRFKCCTCPDFDLCQNCEGKGLHIEHNMFMITQPRVKLLASPTLGPNGEVYLINVLGVGMRQSVQSVHYFKGKY